MAANSKHSKVSGTSLKDPTEYRSVVGALQYVTITRPDIAYAVNRVCQFLHTPTIDHWAAIKCILRYLKGTMKHGFFFDSNPGPLSIQAFSDADWVGCPDDRRSTRGYAIFLGQNLIAWSSKKQATMARSSTESEFRACANTATKILWLKALLDDLGIRLSQAPTIWCDNIGATSLASNPIFHAKTRHIEVDFHFLRDLALNKMI
ncbi:PREDICTED: uncharacterized protein LOC109113961 [Nelumbo nucifera]|uniref:Uncharacterized protein LOC109113961 n=1 Tax=Nelumbo nucifera TaxID=4432 RepID=A0A1U8PY80_NELNU|nr:PREDICTED: uncharacterized protein LOC109113961 [Nelumbo nucifera]